MCDKIKKMLGIGIALAVCLLNWCAFASGELVVIAPVSASASTSYTVPAWGLPVSMINGSGLTGEGYTATHTNASELNLLWHSDGITVSGQWVEFDLGAAYDLKNALIWQLAQSGHTTRGVKVFTISVAGDDHVFSTVSTNNLNIATGSANEPVQVRPLVASDVRYVRFTIQSNYGDNYVGLSEVRFEGVPWELPAPRDLVWNGTSGDAAWNTVAQNWLTNGSATAFATGDNVRFDDTATEKSVTFSNNVMVGAIVVDNTTNYRISAGTNANNRIVAAASLIKRGSGVLELGGGLKNVAGSYHSFTCDVQVFEGTLKTVSAGKNSSSSTPTPVEGLLGNPSVERKIVVTNGATLFFGDNNAIGTVYSTPKVKLEVVDGGIFQSAPNQVTTLGSALFDNAAIAPLTGYYDDWGSLVLNGDLEFKGATPYTITSLKGAYLIIGFTRTPSIMVDDITGDSAADLILDIAIHNTHGIPSSFIKTGVGTLRLNTFLSTFAGNVGVVEGTLETGEGSGRTNQFNNVLGNCKVPRKLTVASGATLKITGNNTLVPGYESALLEIEINGGTLQLGDKTTNVFGPLTLEDATVSYNTGYLITSNWGMMIFSGRVIFKGTQPYVFAPAGENCNFQSGLNEEIEVNVWDITGSSATDAALNLPFINFNTVMNKPPSRFYKTGPGTLSLGAVNTSTGTLRVVEGVLRIDGSWSAVNSSVIAESNGYLGGLRT